MTDTRRLPGWNILPRANFDLNEFAPHHDRLKPGICVVNHEPPVIARLGQGSADTLYIYRDSPAGYGTDDNVHMHTPAADYVRYLHQKAPACAALYLGNEPDDIMSAAEWSLEALKACDEVGRVGVFLNLSFGRPEPHHWAEMRPLSRLLEKMSGTQHVLGLHEYCGPGKIGEGYWIGRVRNVNARCRSIGIEPPRIAITELGVLAFGDPLKQSLNSHKGWQAAGLSGVDMMALMYEAYNIYAALPNVIGTALFCAGNWKEGIRADKDTMVKQRMEAYRLPVTASERPRRPDNALVGIETSIAATKDASGANLRRSPMVTADTTGTVKTGDAVIVFPATWTPGGAWYWVWIETPGGLAGWVADVVTFEAEEANRRRTGPLPPLPPLPPPAPLPIGATLEEVQMLQALHTEIARLHVKASGIYAAIAERAGVKVEANGAG